MNEAEFNSYVARLREAVLFYIKGDSLALGAVISMAALLKLEQQQLVELVVANMWFLVGLGVLVALGLSLEASLTAAASSADPFKNAANAKSARRLYFGFVLLQIVGLSAFLGWTAKSLELLAQR